MGPYLEFTDDENLGTAVPLQGVTAIGRIPDLIARYGKTYLRAKLLSRHPDSSEVNQLIELYEQRTLEVAVEPLEQRKISRLQCLLLPDEGYWYVTDTDSILGTYVNGRQLDRLEKKLLHHGDLIEFSGTGEDALVAAQFRQPAAGKHFAYIVSNPTGDLKGDKKEGRKLRDEFEQRGFETILLENSVATDELEEHIPYFLKHVPQDGFFVFIYAGHGLARTMCLANSTYSYQRLYEQFKPLKGRSAFFISACYSGTALENTALENSIIVTCTLPSDKGADGAFLRSLRRVLEKNTTSLDLSTIPDRLVDEGKYTNKFGAALPQVGQFCSRAVIRSRME